MSALLVTDQPGEAERFADRLAAGPRSWIATEKWGPLHIVLSRVDDAARWGSAHDPRSGARAALVGRLAMEDADWGRAEASPLAGGFAARHVLSAWRNGPETLPRVVNGTASVLIWNPDEQAVYLVTDRMGAIPIYAPSDGRLLLSSVADIVADALAGRGRAPELDTDSLAEFLGTAQVSHPYSYHRGVHALEPGTSYRWQPLARSPGPAAARYWAPVPATAEETLRGAPLVDAIAGALRRAVRRRTLPRLGEHLVLLSGGADSRALLYAAADPSVLRTATLYDVENPELRAARALARSVGARHESWLRDPEYYPRLAQQAVTLCGGMHEASTNHFGGVLDEVCSLGPGGALTGCHADYLLKGLSLNRVRRTLFGRALPLFRLDRYRHEYYHGHRALPADVWRPVGARLAQRYAGCVEGAAPASWRAVEAMRLQPIAREADYAGRMVMLRGAPFDLVTLDSDILDVWMRMPADEKVNGLAFERAVRSLAPEGTPAVANVNYSSALGGTPWTRLRGFLLGVAVRKVRRLARREEDFGPIGTSGSWPDHAAVARRSEALAALWNGVSVHARAPLADLVGFDPWTRELPEWARDDHFVLWRVLTLGLWLDGRRAR